MKKDMWLAHPDDAPSINECPLLYVTVRTLKEILGNNNSHVRPTWRKTQFRYIVVVTRIIQAEPSLIISDNTQILQIKAGNWKDQWKFLTRSNYYRFVIEFDPYHADGLNIRKIEIVKPVQVAHHLAMAVNEQIKNSLHQQFVKINQQTNQTSSNKKMAKYQKIKEIISGLTEFTLDELVEKSGFSQQKVQSTLQLLSIEGFVGNFGTKYIVMQNCEMQEEGQ